MEYGLIGKPLGHSFSAEIHPKLYDCKYEFKEVEPQDLAEFLEKREFKGINVTIPYKREVIKYLDFVDENAENIGAVNTIVNKDGRLSGFNTDFLGLKMLIASNGVSLKDKSVVILGAGATSKTAFAAAKDLGAKSIAVISRREGAGTDTYDNIGKYHATAEIIINTTPVGMFPNNGESAISLDGFCRLEAVFDVVYNPIRTKLITDAKKKGIIAEGGMKMLVFQALYAARLFSGLDIPDRKGFDIFADMQKSKENIVLIGMPASGKSTVGKRLAEALGRDFLDTDDEIARLHGKAPREIITDSGEAVFRDHETAIIKEISKKQGLVIATGGGAVEREINIDLLKENGKILYLDRPLALLSTDSSRPLSSTKEKLERLYERRSPLYKKYADITVSCGWSLKKTVNAALEMI